MLVREREFEFNFLDRPSEKMDGQKPEAHGLQLVDILVEEQDRLVLIEVKDPSCKPKKQDEKAVERMKQERQNFIRKLNNGELINHELAPKARDSYTYIHLMERDTKPILYVFVLGADELTVDDASLVQFKEELLTRLRQETGQPWVRRYVYDCLVLTEKTWALAFPHYALTRVS